MDIHDPLVILLITIAGSVLASSGFWAFIQAKMANNNAESQMLLGLAHDRILWLGMKYIERGYITKDEYENFKVYLYEPYAKLGGNGVGKRIMDAVDQLPIRENPPYERIVNETDKRSV